MCWPNGKGEKEDGDVLRPEKGTNVLKTTTWLKSSVLHVISHTPSQVFTTLLLCSCPIFCSEDKTQIYNISLLLTYQFLTFSIFKTYQHMFLKSSSSSDLTYLGRQLQHPQDHLTKKARSHLPFFFLESLLSNPTTSC